NDRTEQYVKRGAHVPNHLIVERGDRDTIIRVRVRILFFQCGRDRPQIGLGLRYINARFKSAKCQKRVTAALFCEWLRSVCARCVLCNRDVHFSGRRFEGKLKPARHDSDNRVGMALDAQGATDRPLITIKEPHPQIVTENNFESSWSASGLFISTNKPTADRRLDTEDVEELGTHL